jgi:hypothetical protein
LLMRKFSHSRNQHCFAIKIIASIDQICLRLFQKPLFAFRMSDSLYHRHALGFVACRGGNARLISASPVWIVRAYRLPSRYRHNGRRASGSVRDVESPIYDGNGPWTTRRREEIKTWGPDRTEDRADPRKSSPFQLLRFSLWISAPSTSNASSTMRCFFDTKTRKHSFLNTPTERNYLNTLLKKHKVDLVVMEACGPSRWTAA